MVYWANKAVNEGLSVRSVEEGVALDKSTGPSKPGGAKPKPGGRQGLLSEIADSLSDKLNTGVKIALGKKKGQLIIDFATVADLNRILEELGVKRS